MDRVVDISVVKKEASVCDTLQSLRNEICKEIISKCFCE